MDDLIRRSVGRRRADCEPRQRCGVSAPGPRCTSGSAYGLHLIRTVRSEAERQDPHPVFGAFMKSRVSRTFSREEVRDRVLPAYMGLIKQIDDQLGLLFKFMEEQGLSVEFPSAQ